MRKIRRKKSQTFIGIISIVVLTLTVGYSFLSAHLMISGLAHITVYWDVHFDNVEVNTDSVSLKSGDYAPTIDANDSTKLAYKVTLSNPGDFYEFTVDAVNDGSVDAMISEITPQINNQDISNLPTYLTYNVSYSDDVQIKENQILSAHSTETLKVRIEVDQSSSNLPESFEMSFEEGYIKADENAKRVSHPMPLYNILENEANSGSGLVLKYTGSHQDSMTVQASKDIYHWYADNDTDGTKIQDMNNVVFANQCWQMIRTTDTGGVRLLYNGEVENGQCLNTRGNHVGFTGLTNTTIGGYYYGTDYTYDSSTNLFTLAGTVSYANPYVGLFTCREYSATATCSSLAYPVRLSPDRPDTIYDKTYNIFLSKSVPYSLIGKVPFDEEASGKYYNSFGNVGYMFDGFEDERISSLFNPSWNRILNSSYLSTSYYYADSYDYNTTNANKYTLVDPYQVSSSADYSSLVGKYTFFNTNASNSTTYVYYIVGVSGSNVYYINLSGGNDLTAANSTYLYGDSYVDNGNGTFSIPGNNTFTKLDYYNIYQNLPGKYICLKDNSNVCSTLWHVIRADQYEVYIVSSGAQYKVSSGYTYDTTTGNYTIDENDSYVIWDYVSEDVLSILDTHRYTCESTANTCNLLNYTLHQQDEYGISVIGYQLRDGSSLENDLTFPNTTDHILKFEVDYWYQKNILPYDSYVEDSIYCNDRTVTEGFSVNNQRKQYLHFRQHDPTTDLDCPRVGDRFSVSNPQARLTYKVALPTAPEMKLLNNSKIRSSGSEYWLMSPYSFRDETYSYDLVNMIDSNGGITFNTAYSSSTGIRPVITLIPGLEFSSGEGSMEDPYIVSTN